MRGQADNRAIRIGSGGLGVEDEAYHIYTQLFYFADVFRFGHAAYFDTKRSHILERFVVGNLLLRNDGRDEIFQCISGVVGFHKSLSDEKAAETGSTQTANCFEMRDAAFRNEYGHITDIGSAFL